MSIEVLTPIFSAIGAALGTLGLYSVIPNTIINRLSGIFQHKHNVLLEEIKNNNQISLEDLKADYTLRLEELKKDYQNEIEVYKTGLQTIARYSEYQFKLYNELWTSLYELKSKAEDLWEHASTRNLTKFAEQLKDTKKKIEQNILLINEEHYQALIHIIETFERYKVGKDTLISYRNRPRRREATIDNIGHNELEFIGINEQVKNEYIILVQILANDFKKHLREPI